MKTAKKTIISLATLTALSCIGAAGFCAQKNAPVLAEANTIKTALISPESYAQYLPLVAPTDIAVTANFTAIADGKNIYIYEGDITNSDTLGVYHVYTHDSPVSQLAFDEENNLYFLSGRITSYLYKLPTSTLTSNPTAENMNIVCSGFTIKKDTLYFYSTSKDIICHRSLTNSDSGENYIELSTPLQNNSPLAYGLEGLYYVSENNNTYTLHAVNTETGSSNAIATFTHPLKSVSIANHLLCLVTNNGEFYAYNYNDLRAHKNAETVTPITNTSADETDINGYTAIYTHNNKVFAIRGNSVRQYETANASFTNFEITSTSASDHRLNGANDIFLAEDKLFIADDGNDRISVYNTKTDTFEIAISTTLESPFITAYKDTLLVASSQEVALYNLSAAHYGETLLTFSDDELDGEVIGAACVYDRYYLLTDDNYTYTLTANNGAWSYTEQQKITLNGMKATSFTADVYGSLYVAYDSGEVYRFTEKELASQSATGTRILDGLTSVDKIAVDYGENLYALYNGVLTKYTQNAVGMYEVNTTFTPNYGLVKDENPVLASFAFGVDTPDTYFLYENDYVVKSDELQIPKVSPIPVGNAADCIFGADNRDFTMVTVKEDAILTEFDLTALQSATEFPYIAFERCYTPFTALKIGEEDVYTILVVPNGEIGYKTYLAETAFCEELPSDTYYTTYADTTKTGYLTSAVCLYKFPYLNASLTVTEIPRGTQVILLGEISQLDRTYYEISYTDENGEVQTGFIPTSYVNLFDGTAPNAQTVTYGETTDDTDSVGRMLYLLLGLGAIGILLDFLLLKKPKETDEL